MLDVSVVRNSVGGLHHEISSSNMSWIQPFPLLVKCNIRGHDPVPKYFTLSYDL